MKDFNVIREMVQKLCQTSHPLAKSMDYLQVNLACHTSLKCPLLTGIVVK